MHCQDYTYYSNPHKSYSRINYIFIKHQPSIEILKSKIDTRNFSDHAAILATCMQEEQPRRHQWRLDNYLLLNEEVKACVRRELNLFFSTNKGMQNKPILWDAFKAYIQGVFISKNVYINKCQKKTSKEMLYEIARLEAHHKRLGEDSIKR